MFLFSKRKSGEEEKHIEEKVKEERVLVLFHGVNFDKKEELEVWKDYAEELKGFFNCTDCILTTHSFMSKSELSEHFQDLGHSKAQGLLLTLWAGAKLLSYYSKDSDLFGIERELLESRANNIAEIFVRDHVKPGQSYFFVGHSFGGLVVHRIFQILSLKKIASVTTTASTASDSAKHRFLLLGSPACCGPEEKTARRHHIIHANDPILAFHQNHCGCFERMKQPDLIFIDAHNMSEYMKTVKNHPEIQLRLGF